MDIPCRVRLTEAVGKHPAGLTGTLVDVGDDHVFIRLDGGRLLKVPCPYFPELPYEPVSVCPRHPQEARRQPPGSAM